MSNSIQKRQSPLALPVRKDPNGNRLDLTDSLRNGDARRVFGVTGANCIDDRKDRRTKPSCSPSRGVLSALLAEVILAGEAIGQSVC